MSNSSAIAAINSNVVARFNIPKLPPSQAEQTFVNGVLQPVGIFEGRNPLDLVSYLWDLVTFFNNVSSRSLGNKQAWCLLTPIKKGSNAFTIEPSLLQSGLSELLTPQGEMQLAIIKTPFDKNISISLQNGANFSPSLSAPQRKNINLKAVDFTDYLTGNALGSNVVDFILGTTSALQQILDNPVTSAVGNAVFGSFAFLDNLQIIQYEDRGRNFGNLSLDSVSNVSAIGPIGFSTSNNENTKSNKFPVFALLAGASLLYGSPLLALPFGLLAIKGQKND
mgnify:CR=1 FL=1